MVGISELEILIYRITSERHCSCYIHPQDPALRINAAVAVACLAGHEESHQRLLITEDLVEEMLDVLEASCQVQMTLRGIQGATLRYIILIQPALEYQLISPPSLQGVMHHGTFWTVWKLCQGFANLTINDRNKVLGLD